MLLVKSIALNGWLIKPPRSGVIQMYMNLQSSSNNMFLLIDSETLMHIFTFLFLLKATYDWVTKNNETNLQLQAGHFMIAIAHHQLNGSGLRRHQKGISIHRHVCGFYSWIVVPLCPVYLLGVCLKKCPKSIFSFKSRDKRSIKVQELIR